MAPSNPSTSLAQIHPHRLDVYLMLALAIGALVAGLTLPTIEMKELIFRKNSFSIMAGIQTLYEEKYYFLALVIFVFSIVFPILKLCTLSVLWLVPMAERTRAVVIEWLEIAGKWSMLDVFVVALMIIVTRSSGLVKAKPLPGIYWFMASVVVSMILSTLVKRFHERKSGAK